MSLAAYQKIIEDLEDRIKEKDEENISLQGEIRGKNEEIERLDEGRNNDCIKLILLVTTMMSISLITLIK